MENVNIKPFKCKTSHVYGHEYQITKKSTQASKPVIRSKNTSEKNYHIEVINIFIFSLFLTFRVHYFFVFDYYMI